MKRIRNAAFQIFAVLLIGPAMYGSTLASSQEVSLYRPGTGLWYSMATDGAGAFRVTRFGRKDDIPVPADYDDDGTEDAAMWRPGTGEWIVERSSDGKEFNIKWGGSGSPGASPDMPVPADYDGDGIADIAVFRPDNATWYILLSSTGFDPQKASVTVFGAKGDVPVPADYDGDGKADLAVFRPTENRWDIEESGSGVVRTEIFGLAGDYLLVPGDYTGDGRADIAIFRRGTWMVKSLETGEIERFEMGTLYSIPIVKDLDGDGIIDFASFENGVWNIYYSSEPRFSSFRFGQPGDVPADSIKARPSIGPHI